VALGIFANFHTPIASLRHDLFALCKHWMPLSCFTGLSKFLWFNTRRGYKVNVLHVAVPILLYLPGQNSMQFRARRIWAFADHIFMFSMPLRLIDTTCLRLPFFSQKIGPTRKSYIVSLS
jgi:hypothetical protein